MSRTLINWNDGFDACLKQTPGASGTSGTSQISHYGSDTTPIDTITSDNERFDGYKSYKVTIKPPQSGRPRSYASIDVPNIPANGLGLEKWYFHSYYLGDPNVPADFGHISTANKDSNSGTAICGFRYVAGGQKNGPRGWLGLAPSGYPNAGGGGTIITPGNYLSGSTLPDGPYFVKNKWVDSIIHVKWGARGTSYASTAFAEVWIKFATEPWSKATYGKTSLVATMYYQQSDFTGSNTASAASAYAWVGMYTGNQFFSLGDPSVSCYHGPWVIGDSFAEVDLPTEFAGGGPPPPTPVLTVNPTSLSFSGTQGGSDPTAKTTAVSIANPGTDKSVAAVGVPAGWTVTPSSLVAPASFSVRPSIGTKTAGTYNNSFQVDPGDPLMPPQNVSVKLVVAAAAAPVTTATPASLSFLGTTGNVDPDGQTVSVSVTPAPSSNSVTVTAPTGWQVASNPTTPTWQQAITVTQPATFAVKPVMAGRLAGTADPVTLTVDSADATALDDTVTLNLTVTSGTTSIKAIDVDDTAGFLTGAGLTSQQAIFQGGQAVFSLTTGPTALVTHPANIIVPGGAIEFGPWNWATRNASGTGELSQRAAVDWGSGNRAVLERRTVYNTASQTPTTDRFNLILRASEIDIGPTIPSFDVSGILSGAVTWLKIGLGADGKTVTYQVADDSKAYVELGTRVYADAALTSPLASATSAMSTPTGDLLVTSASVGSFHGASVQANPPGGGTPVLSNSALTWVAPGQTRSMPISDTGGTGSFAFLGTVAASTRNVIPNGVARTDVTPERYFRIDATNAAVPNQLQMRGSGGQVWATGLIVPRDTYVLIVVSFNFTTNLWNAHVVNMVTGAVQHTTTAFTGNAQTTLTSGTFAASRFVVGAQIPGSGGFSTLYYIGKGSVFGAVAAEVTSSAVEAAAGSAHISSRSLMKTLLAGGHVYEAKGSVSTAMQDLIGTNHETLGERVTPSGTPVADYTTVDVPYDPTQGTVPTPPSPTPAPPPPATKPAVTNAQATDATTGQATVTVPTPSASGWTPNATPVGLFMGIVSQEGDLVYAQQGSWSSSGVFSLTGLALDTTYRVVGRYRDSAGTLSNFSDYTEFFIPAPSTTISDVIGIEAVQSRGGLLDAWWTPNPTPEGVDEYDVYYAPVSAGTTRPALPNWQGAGTLVTSGPRTGKLQMPQRTDLDDLLEYYVWVEAHEPS